MIAPSLRLILTVALVAVPVAIAAALLPWIQPIAIVSLLALAIVVCIDAALRRRVLADLAIELPAVVRSVKDREIEIRVRIRRGVTRVRRLRIGIVAPQGIEADWEDQRVDLPTGSELADISWRITPRERGTYSIRECYLEATSLFGFWSVRRRQAVALELRVYPNLARDLSLSSFLRPVEGIHKMRQIGRGREFEKLREYVAGDSSDEIHWKATARRARPITKVFQVERTQEVYVIIDSSRLSARPIGNEIALEHAIRAALVVGAATERRNDLFGLAAFSSQVEVFVRARAGKTHYAACRDAINNLRPRLESPDFFEVATFLQLRLRRRALLLFLTGLDDPVLSENFVRATQVLSRRHLVVTGMLRPQAAQELFHDPKIRTTDDIYGNLAGHLAWRKLRELERVLAQQGVRFTLLEPESISQRLVGLCDEIKQRQLL